MAVSALLQQQGWSGLPLYALGASSGGAFALLLALQMPLQVAPVSPMSIVFACWQIGYSVSKGMEQSNSICNKKILALW